MNGIWNLLKRVIPIITLICFICLGITHTFSLITDENITYMSKVYYNTETWQVIENPTEEQKETAYTYYSLDTINYLQNINADNLKNSTQRVFDLQAFENTINQFNQIWDNGYQLGDGVRTLINGLLLIFNGLLTAINGILWPVRIVSAIILTAFTLVGIKINNNGIITTTLQWFVNSLAIPLINPTTNVDTNTTLNNQYVKFINQNLTLGSALVRIKLDFYFESNNRTFTALIADRNIMYYYNVDLPNEDKYTTVYQNGQWVDQAWRDIYITNYNALTDSNVAKIEEFIAKNALDMSLWNTTWQWTNTDFSQVQRIEQSFHFTAIPNTQTGISKNYVRIVATYSANANIIVYYDANGIGDIIYNNGNWGSSSQTFTVTDQNEFTQITTTQLQTNLLNTYCTQV